jgi:putative NADH-flavin reductase
VKLLIFGSTGSIGRQLVEQALAQGHAVTAFVRNPAKLDLKHSKLKVVQGDVLDYASVERAVPGQEAVLSALGTPAFTKNTVRSEGTRNIIRAMEKVGVQNWIKQSQTDWTIIRPGAFTDGDRSGAYRHSLIVTDKAIKAKISRADVADFMLKQLEDRTYLHQTPWISY